MNEVEKMRAVLEDKLRDSGCNAYAIVRRGRIDWQRTVPAAVVVTADLDVNFLITQVLTPEWALIGGVTLFGPPPKSAEIGRWLYLNRSALGPVVEVPRSDTTKDLMSALQREQARLISSFGDDFLRAPVNEPVDEPVEPLTEKTSSIFLLLSQLPEIVVRQMRDACAAWGNSPESLVHLRLLDEEIKRREAAAELASWEG